jgi:tetratricopeptide (TPR) repeat protein
MNKSETKNTENKSSVKLVEALKEGKKLLKESNYKEALKFFNKSVELNEDSSVLWAANGLLYLKLEEYDSAEESFWKAIENNSLNPYYWAGLGYVLSIKNDYEKAKEAYQTALEKGIKIEELLVSHLRFVQKQIQNKKNIT